MTLFHETARSFSNCGTRVISAFGACAKVRLPVPSTVEGKPDTANRQNTDIPSIVRRITDPALPAHPARPAHPAHPAHPLAHPLLEAEQLRSVLPADPFALVVGDRQLVHRFEHQQDAADLVRV